MDATMEKLYDMLCEELEEIAQKPELSAGDLDVMHKLVVTKEKLLRIDEIETSMGYSGDGEWTAYGSYGRGGYNGYSRGRYSRNTGNSYRNRDSRGRYSSRGYSMAEGRGMIADQLRGMMEDENLAPNERQALQKAMEQMNR